MGDTMAPESNTRNANILARQSVAVPRPNTGANVTVNSSAGGQLQLNFDPSVATPSRSGNDLSFDVEGGGKVTVKDFFAVGDESLPSLRLPDGTVVASTDFFSGSGLDMTTAAGPGGSSAAGSGSGEYADDAGALIDGIGRFGKLGTDFWNRGTEAPEIFDGRATPIIITISPWNPDYPGGPDDPFRPGLNMTGDRLRMAENVLHGGTAHRHEDGEANPTGSFGLRIVSNDGLAALIIDGVRYNLVPDPDDPRHFTLNLPDLPDASGVGHLSGGDVYVVGSTYTVIIDYTLDTNYLGHNQQGVETSEVGSFQIAAVGQSGTRSSSTVIHIDIIDDVPIARADEGDLGGESTFIEGNVILGTVNGQVVDGAADEFGADGKAAVYLEWVNKNGAPNMSVTLDDSGEKITLTWNPDTHVLMGSDGKKYGTMNEVSGARFDLKKSEIAALNDLNLIPMVYEDNRVMAFSNKTLFNGNNIGLQEYPIVRVFDWVGKVFMNFFNDVAFQKFDKGLKDATWEQIVGFLNDYKGKLFEDYTFDREGIRQDPVTKDITIAVNIKPFFAAKNFYIKLEGHDGKEGREWKQDVE